MQTQLLHFSQLAGLNTWDSDSGNDSRPTSGFASSASDSDVRTPMTLDTASPDLRLRTCSNASSIVDSGTGSSQSIDTTGRRSNPFAKSGLATTSVPTGRSRRASMSSTVRSNPFAKTTSVPTGRSRSASVSSTVSTTDIDDYMKMRRDDSWDTLTTSSSSSLVAGTSIKTLDEEPEEAPRPQRRRSIVHKSSVCKLHHRLPVYKTLSAPANSRRLSQVSDCSRRDSEVFEPVDDVFTAPPIPEDEPERGLDSPVEKPRTRSRSSLYRLLNGVPGSKFMSLPRSAGSEGSSTLWHDRHFVIQDEVAIFVVLPAFISQGQTGRGRRLKGSFSPYTRVGNVTKILLEVSLALRNMKTKHLSNLINPSVRK